LGRFDYATLPPWEQLEPGGAPATVDRRIDEVGVDIERLRRALEVRDRNRSNVNSLLISIERKV